MAVPNVEKLGKTTDDWEAQYLEDAITYLMEKWYKIIEELGPRKVRDCHFEIKKIWSGDQPPKYVVYHRGYIIGFFEITCDSFQQAQSYLLLILLIIVSDISRWLKHRSATAKNEWASNSALHMHYFEPKNIYPERCIVCGQWKTPEAEEQYHNDPEAFLLYSSQEEGDWV